MDDLLKELGELSTAYIRKTRKLAALQLGQIPALIGELFQRWCIKPSLFLFNEIELVNFQLLEPRLLIEGALGGQQIDKLGENGRLAANVLKLYGADAFRFCTVAE